MALLIYLYFQESFVTKHHKVNWLSGVSHTMRGFIDKRFSLLSLSFLLFVVAYLMFFQYFPIILDQRYDFTDLAIGYYIANYGLWFALASLFLTPYLLKKVSLSHLAWISTLGLMVAMAGFMMRPDELSIWFLGGFAALPSSVGYVTFIVLYSKAAEEQHQGIAMGIAGALFALGWAVGPLLSGILSDFSLSTPLVVAFLLALASLIVTIKMAPSLKRRSH